MRAEGLSLVTRSVEETIALGERLGALLEAGDFVSLEGPLGAGKSRLVEGIARGLGVDRDRRIPSPTFTIVNEHQGRLLLVHADLYRLRSAEELAEIGWRDYLRGEAVVAVEWLSVVGEDMAPADRLDVVLEMAGDERSIELIARGPRAAKVVEGLDGPDAT